MSACPKCGYVEMGHNAADREHSERCKPTPEVPLPELPEPDFSCGDCTIGEVAYSEATLRAYALAALAARWRPMDSAPRDGSFVLLAQHESVFKGHYSKAGFWSVHGSIFGLADDAFLGWQPLPQPPSAPEGT